MHGSVGLVYTGDVTPDATSTADRVGQIAGPAHGQEHTGLMCHLTINGHFPLL